MQYNWIGHLCYQSKLACMRASRQHKMDEQTSSDAYRRVFGYHKYAEPHDRSVNCKLLDEYDFWRNGQ